MTELSQALVRLSVNPIFAESIRERICERVPYGINLLLAYRCNDHEDIILMVEAEDEAMIKDYVLQHLFREIYGVIAIVTEFIDPDQPALVQPVTKETVIHQT